jgi:hypothetical protein
MLEAAFLWTPTHLSSIMTVAYESRWDNFRFTLFFERIYELVRLDVRTHPFQSVNIHSYGI